MEPGRLVVPLLLNERPILGHILESLENRLQGDLILAGEFFGSVRGEIRCQLIILARGNPVSVPYARGNPVSVPYAASRHPE